MKKEYFKTRFETLSTLTTMIRELNRGDPRLKSFKAPTFYTWGLKTKKLDPTFYGPQNLMEICTKYRDGERTNNPKRI